MPENRYKYDAFISYRHLPSNMWAAKAVQRLLERYRPPRGTVCTHTDYIWRVFRDQSELPTSVDLGTEIHEALENSAFLIVLCSPALQESEWCMEEIRTFKALHGGRIDRILPLLIEGEPCDAFPPELRFEEFTVPDENGTETLVRREVEPLAADIRASSRIKSRHKLYTEFLRLAASILGTEFDALYRRQRRKQRNRRIAAAIGAAVIAATMVGMKVYYTLKTHTMQSDTYSSRGAQAAQEGNTQQALAYYAALLELGSSADISTGQLMAMLLQQTAWPYLADRTDGFFMNGQVITPDDSQYTLLKESDNAALTADGEWSLIGQTVTNRTDGTTYSLALDDETAEYSYSALDGNTWVLKGDQYYYFYTPATDTLLSLDIEQYRPRPICGDRVAAKEEDCLYIYRIADGGLVQQEKIKFSDVFANGVDAEDSDSTSNYISSYTWTDEKGEFLLWQCEDSAVLLDLRGETTVSLTISEWKPWKNYDLWNVAIDRTQGMIALAYAPDPTIIIPDIETPMGDNESYLERRVHSIFGQFLSKKSKKSEEETTTSSSEECEGYVAVYRLADGECVLRRELTEGAVKVCFAHSSPLLLTMGDGALRVWNLDTGEEAAATLNLGYYPNAMFSDDDSAVLVYNKYSTIDTYRFAVPNTVYSDSGEEAQATAYEEYEAALSDERQEQENLLAALGKSESLSSAGELYNALALSDGTQILVASTGFYRVDEDGTVLSSLPLADTDYADLCMEGDGVLTQSESAVYAIARNVNTGKKCVLRLTLSSRKNKVGVVAALDCNGYTPQRIYCGGKMAAVQIGENYLLIFNAKDTSPSWSLMPEQSGTISEVAINADDTLLAVELTVTDISDNSLHMETSYSVLELWSAAQNLVLGTLGDGYSVISGVRFEEEKGLCYFLDSTPQQLWLPSGALSQADYSAVAELVCYEAYYSDEDKCLIQSKTPALSLENTCWESRITAGGPLVAAAESTASNSVDARYAELYSQYDGDRLAALEALAQEIADGAVQTDLTADDTFYNGYLSAVCEAGTQEQIEAVFRAYTARIEAAIASDEDLSAYYPDALIRVMQYTTALDDQIYNALSVYYAAFLEQEKDTQYYTAETEYSAFELNLVQGNISALQQLQKDGALDSSESSFPSAYCAAALLMLGDPTEAADELYEEWLLYTNAGESYKNYAMAHVLGFYYALAQRGYFAQEDIEQCLKLTAQMADDFSPGLAVSGVTATGQANGFYCGDIIVTVNGDSVLSVRQLQDLLAEGEVTCRVLRSGELMTITLPAGTEELGAQLRFTYNAE